SRLQTRSPYGPALRIADRLLVASRAFAGERAAFFQTSSVSPSATLRPRIALHFSSEEFCRMKTFRCLALASLVLFPWLRIRAQESAPKPASAAPRNITIDDYFQIRDVSQPEISLDGQWVVYAVRTRMLKEDKNEQRLWMISTRGGDPLPLSAESVSSGHARWSPNGKYISFLSARDGGKSQVWLLDRRGGEAVRLTDAAQGVDDFEWSPDSKRLVLILRDPKPEDLEAAKNKEKPAPATPPKPKTPPPFVIDRLQFKRDTVGYLDRRRTHLYLLDIAAKGTRQITSGDFDD